MSCLSDLISTVDGLSVYLDCDLRQLMSWVCLSYLPRASRCHEDADFSLSRCPVGSPLFLACTLSTMVRTWREEKERDSIGGWLQTTDGNIVTRTSLAFWPCLL